MELKCCRACARRSKNKHVRRRPDEVLKLPFHHIGLNLCPPSRCLLYTSFLPSPVSHVFRVRPDYSNGTRYVSPILSPIPSLTTEAKARVSTSHKVSLRGHCDIQAIDGGSFQYHALATGTILFYDYLLTLSDEVCPYFSSTAFQLTAETRFLKVKYAWSGQKTWSAQITWHGYDVLLTF